jgi:hypothetical protein
MQGPTTKFDKLLLKNTVKNSEIIREYELMIHYKKKDQHVHIQICKFIVL